MLKTLSIRSQIWIAMIWLNLGFLLTMLLVGVLLSQVTHEVRQINEVSMPNVLMADEMDLSRSEVQQFLTDVSATHDTDGYKDAQESAQRFSSNLEKFRQQAQRQTDEPTLKRLATLEGHFNNFYALGKTMAQAYLDKGMEAGNALMKGTASRPGFDAASTTLAEEMSAFRKEQIALADSRSANALRKALGIDVAMVISGLSAAFVAAVLGLLIVRSITRPINAAVEVAQAVASGNLTVAIRPSGGLEATRLLSALQEMQNSLSELVTKVRQSSEGVAHTSTEIASGNQSLSSRTETQVHALGQTAASMEELGVTVNQNAENATQANQLAQAASRVATRGGEVVGQVVHTMKDINDSSKKIFDIISVIDGIAFQTNILALNAAVEAARAGEQGRGFAVVATEVRSLAGRSAEAAREIKALISASVERVEQGTSQVDQAGSTMQEVVDSIRRVTDIVSEISLASEKQSSGVRQVGEAVASLDQTTQQNAAMVEGMANSVEHLRGQASALVAAVSVFKLSDHDA